MAARKKASAKRKTGGGSDSSSVSTSPKMSLVGAKKKTDNSTSYGTKTITHSAGVKAPNYPYGQLHKKVGPVKKK